jgi:hypothetical protein
MPGGAVDGGSPPQQSKKFRLRSKSCPARISGPKPASYFDPETPQKNWFDETDSYDGNSERQITLERSFDPPSTGATPVPSVPSREYPSVFFSTSATNSVKYDIAPETVQFLLDTVSHRLREFVRLGYLQEVEPEENTQNVD